MRIKCKSIACEVYYTPDAQHRFGGFCSPECQRANTHEQPGLALGEVVTLTVRGHVIPTNTIIHRRHANQNWKLSHE